MSHFYGTLHGQARTPATRRGTARGGITTHAAGWSGAIRVAVWHDETNGTDRYDVSLVPWQSSGGHGTQLAEGILDANSVGGTTLLPGAWGEADATEAS